MAKSSEAHTIANVDISNELKVTNENPRIVPTIAEMVRSIGNNTEAQAFFINPMKKKGTTFYFKDLAAHRLAKITIFIYNQNGRLVYKIPNAKSGITHWDGRDFYGRLLANGLYHYVVRSEVPATENSKKRTFIKKQKLLISR